MITRAIRFPLIALSVMQLLGLAFSAFPPPCSASEELYEVRLDRGLSNTEPYSYLLIEQAVRERGRARELLETARHYSPNLPAVYFELAKASFSPSAQGMFESVEYFRKGINAYERNFWWQFHFAGMLSVAAVLSFVLSLILTAAIRFPLDYRLLSHDVQEDKRRLLTVVPLVILPFFGLPAFLAGLFVLIGVYFRSRDRVLVYGILLALLFSPFFASGVRMFISPPFSELRAMADVNEGRDNRYALSALKDNGQYAQTFSYALALKREGHYENAVAVYKQLLASHADPKVYTNLGNAYHALGSRDLARETYEKAITAGSLPSTFYNLSQTYREMLDFPKGEEYFLKAAQLDREALSRFAVRSSSNPNRFVIDETLPPSFLWKYAWGESRPVSFSSLLAFVMISAFFVLDTRAKGRAQECKRCGTIFCGRCSRTLAWGGMCHQCHKFFVKIEELDSRERIGRLLALHQRLSARRRLAKVLSFIIPGAGQIYARRVLPGFLFLWLFAFSLAVLALNRVPFVGVFPFTQSWLNPAALLVAAATYLFSVFHMLRGINRGWL